MPDAETPKTKNTNADHATGSLSSEDKDRLIEIWKKSIETQMHFNEMSGKSRQLGLTFVAAALGVAVVMLARGDDFALIVLNWKIHVGVPLILAAILALWGVRRLDLNVYHRMLRGAVTFGEDFERSYMKHIFDLEMGMTQAISHYSRHTDAKVDKSGRRYSYIGEDFQTAEKKIQHFYRDTMGFLVLAAVALFGITNFADTRFERVAPQTSEQTGPVDATQPNTNVGPQAPDTP